MPKKIFKDFHIQTPKEAIFRRLGKKYKTKITPRVENKIDQIISQGSKYLKTSGIYDIRTFELIKEKKTRKIIIDKTLIITSKSLFDLLKNSTNVVILAATIGSEISKQVETDMKKGRMSEAVILDAYASETVEEAVNYIQGILDRGMSLQGYKLTRRFSPGYGDIELNSQPKILEFIDSGEIGITINESNIMTPEKSITAFIGLEKN